MDTWAEGDTYHRYMGRWSAPVAQAFLSWLDTTPNRDWLDVGCGTGALSTAIIEMTGPAHLAAIDSSGGFIEVARQRLGDGPDLRVADAQALPHPDDSFDVAVSGLCLNFVPSPEAAVREMRRVTRYGGSVGAYVWDYAGGMEMIRTFWDLAIDLDPAARELDETLRFPLCQAEPLSELFEQAELDSVQITSLDVPTTFVDFDDYWHPFLGGQGPAPSYVASLDEPRRSRLADGLERALPTSPNGHIELMARAWAVRGTVAS